MSFLKCKSCGGNLLIKTASPLAECEYCGSIQPYPKFDDDERRERYNAADFERKNHNFDNALVMFGEMAIKSGSEAEVYWEKVLCRYGILLENDPDSQKVIPTLNRTQVTSIFDDPDYAKALEYSFGTTAHEYYAEMAKKIEQTRLKYLRIANCEEPYNVFICYKESDDRTGLRTQDSIKAQQLYDHLTESGYRVFFSRITLEDKAGEEYEPYIFAALNSAKVMFAFGSKREYVTSPWVKNEWSRFRKLMTNPGERLLIPMFYEKIETAFPSELSKIEGYSFNRPGWFQDAKNRVDAFTGRKSTQPFSAGSADALFKNAETNFSVLNNQDAARKNYMELTDHYPHDYRGWWGLIRVETGNFQNPDDFEVKKPDLLQFFHNVRKTASEKAYDSAEGDVKDYLGIVAEHKRDCEETDLPRFVEQEVPKRIHKLRAKREENNYLISALAKEESAYLGGVIPAIDKSTPKVVAQRASRIKKELEELENSAQNNNKKVKKEIEDRLEKVKPMSVFKWIIPLWIGVLSLRILGSAINADSISFSESFVPPISFLKTADLIAKIGFPSLMAIVVFIKSVSSFNQDNASNGKKTTFSEYALGLFWATCGWLFAAWMIGVWSLIVLTLKITDTAVTQQNSILEIACTDYKAIPMIIDNRALFLIVFIIGVLIGVIVFCRYLVDLSRYNHDKKSIQCEKMQLMDEQALAHQNNRQSIFNRFIEEIRSDSDQLKLDNKSLINEDNEWSDWVEHVIEYLSDPRKAKENLYYLLCNDFGIEADHDEEFGKLAQIVHAKYK